ncbi:MAG TPA: Mth938-like domain-containing protein [Burkholderiales bacterium]|nr:Mth938-like domain-containing protein [Burkholderiales bacterium]
MKLHSTPAEGLQLFSGYGTGYVSVNSVRHERSVVVTPQAVVEWPVAGFEALTAADFSFIGELKPEVVVLGTGLAQRFPAKELARALAATGVGVEVMDTRAACRTYNILASEGRKVAAAVLVG